MNIDKESYVVMKNCEPFLNQIVLALIKQSIKTHKLTCPCQSWPCLLNVSPCRKSKMTLLTKGALLAVLELEVLIRKLVAVDRLAAST